MTQPDTFYPHLRDMLDERFAALPDRAIESVFAKAFGENITPAEYEEFFAGLGKAFQSALPTLQSIGQGALSGAATGSVAGPYGALAGALLGGLGGGLSHVHGPAGDVGRGIGGVVNLAGTLTGSSRGGGLGALIGGASGAAPAGRGGAAAALGAALQRPETRQALQALASGGNPSVPVGGTSAPASAFAGLLGALGREAAEAYDNQLPDVVPGYLLDGRGQPVVDPRDEELRAARLLALLSLSARTDPPHYGDALEDGFEEHLGDQLDEAWVDEAWVDPLPAGYF